MKCGSMRINVDQRVVPVQFTHLQQLLLEVADLVVEPGEEPVLPAVRGEQRGQSRQEVGGGGHRDPQHVLHVPGAHLQGLDSDPHAHPRLQDREETAQAAIE